MEIPEFEVILVVETPDDSLVHELHLLLPEEDVSVANRAIGGLEIKAFFTLGVAALQQIFNFISRNRDRSSQASLIIGKDRIRLDNVNLEDALAFLESEPVQKLVKTYARKNQ